MESSNDQSTFNDDAWSDLINFNLCSPAQPLVNLCDSVVVPDAHPDLQIQCPAPISNPEFAKSNGSIPQSSSHVNGPESGSTSCSAAQNPAQNLANEQDSLQSRVDADLTAKIQQLHQAVSKNLKRQAPLSDDDDDVGGDNGVFGKFRVKLSAANREKDVPKPKKTRMKRSEQRTCLPCRATKSRVSRLLKASTTTDSIIVFTWAVLHPMC